MWMGVRHGVFGTIDNQLRIVWEFCFVDRPLCCRSTYILLLPNWSATTWKITWETNGTHTTRNKLWQALCTSNSLVLKWGLNADVINVIYTTFCRTWRTGMWMDKAINPVTQIFDILLTPEYIIWYLFNLFISIVDIHPSWIHHLFHLGLNRFTFTIASGVSIYYVRSTGSIDKVVMQPIWLSSSVGTFQY